MKIEAWELGKVLMDLFAKYSTGKDVAKDFGQSMVSCGFGPGYAEAILGASKALPLESEDEMFFIVKSFHEATNNPLIAPGAIFTDEQIDKYSGHKVSKKLSKSQLVFNDVIKLNDDEYVTVVSYQQIKELYNNKMFRYNFNTQRQQKVYKGMLVPYCNKRSENEIAKLMLEGNFSANAITINMLDDENLNQGYDAAGRTLTIMMPSNVDIIDGFHRVKGCLKALSENPQIQGSMILSIKRYTEDRAAAFILQEDKRNAIPRDRKVMLQQGDRENQIVKYLSTESTSEWNGRITTGESDKTKLHFKALSDAVKDSFDIYNQLQVDKVRRAIKDKVNEAVSVSDLFLTDNKLAVALIKLIGYGYLKGVDINALLRKLASEEVRAKLEGLKKNKEIYELVENEVLGND